MGKGEIEGGVGGFFGETLGLGAICYNVLYSFSLMVVVITGAVGLGTYQWISNDAVSMAEAKISFDYVGLDSINQVTCGLMSYCIDAKGAVSECSLPWPTWGSGSDAATGIPHTLWQAAAGCITLGLILNTTCFVYSMIACFGCFSTKAQKWSMGASSIGGLFMLIGIVLWFASWGDYAVSECRSADTTDEACGDWKGLLPDAVFATTYGGEKDAIGCRICNYQQKGFQPDEKCQIGYGPKAVGVSCAFTFISSWLGSLVKSEQDKRNELQG